MEENKGNRPGPTETQIEIMMSDWLGGIRGGAETDHTHKGKEGIRSDTDVADYLLGNLDNLDKLSLMRTARHAARSLLPIGVLHMSTASRREPSRRPSRLLRRISRLRWLASSISSCAASMMFCRSCGPAVMARREASTDLRMLSSSDSASRLSSFNRCNLLRASAWALLDVFPTKRSLSR